jgi:polysaccharide biosynthesis protein PslG
VAGTIRRRRPDAFPRREFLALPFLVPLLGGCLPHLPPLPLLLTARRPKVGVHTRLTDEVEPAKIAKTLDMVVAMGASWIVEYFPWAYVEVAPGLYEWGHADLVVNAAVDRGLTLVARIDMTPDWARPANTTARYLDRSGYAAYAAYLAAFARRYRGKIGYLQVWNEPNTSFEWGYRPPDPAGYAAMLRTVYPVVKDADPAIRVVSAGLAANLATGGIAVNDLTYLDGLYAAGAAPAFDVLGSHAYGDILPADAPPDPQQLNFQRVLLHRASMLRHGDGAKAVLITEAGWNDAPRWTHAVSPAARIANTVEAYRLAETWPWLLALCMWEFRLPARAGTAEDYATFVDVDFTPRAIYDTVTAYAQGGD